MTKLNIEYRPISELKPNEKNPRKITRAELNKLKRSIKEFGFIDPVIINNHKDRKDIIIGGHQRIEAARALGMKEVPVVYVSVPEDKEYLLNMALNEISGSWDEEKLYNLLKELNDKPIDMTLSGFDEAFIDEILSREIDVDKERLLDIVPALPKNPLTKRGDIYALGMHKLMCGDSTKAEDVDKLMEGAIADAAWTDPPSYSGDNNPNGRDWGVMTNDELRGDKLYEFLLPAYKNMAKHTKDNSALYTCYASINHMIFEKALNNAGFIVKQQIIWNKGHILGHSDYHYAHEPCQPAGTMVRKVINAKATEKGRRGAFSEFIDVPIETLKDGDLVVSYNPLSCVVHTRGRLIKTAKRQYNGDLVSIKTNGKSTKSTTAHKFTIRLDRKEANRQVIYLMRKGDWWRIGQVRLFNSRGFGLASRLTDEKGEEAWIITTAKDTLEALMLEQALSCKYGIPTTHWTVDKFNVHPERCRSSEAITRIYEIIGMDNIHMGAMKLLADHHRSLQHPILTSRQENAFSRVMSRTVQASNLIAGIMQLPIPTEAENFTWETISDITYTPFSGEVYSLDVDRDGHYIADGIITHNCLYCMKKDHNTEWTGDRTQKTIIMTKDEKELEEFTKEELLDIIKKIREDSDLISMQKDAAQEYLHPTQKPVALSRRRMFKNNTRPNDIVLDLFGGSGSTLLAAETSKRVCYAMEIDPAYCDVIVKRWEDYTGKKAELISKGE